MAFKQEPFNEAVVSDILAYFDVPYITYYLDYMSDEAENVNRLSGGLEYVIHRIVSMIVVIMDLLSTLGTSKFAWHGGKRSDDTIRMRVQEC